MKQRILAFLTAFCMVLALLPAQAFASEHSHSDVAALSGSAPSRQTITGTYTNPLYESVPSPQRLAAPQYFADGEEEFDPGAYFTEDVDVLNAIRSGLEARSATITVPWRINQSDVADDDAENTKLKTLILTAALLSMSHTGVPTQGDYLLWHYYEIGFSANRIATGTDDYYYLDITFAVTYYTTAEQEAELTAALEPVMASFGFTAETDDYTKVKTIYDYICANVTYDYTNLENEAYTLKFSAYAALINGTAVCQGYATLFYRMLLMAGVDTRVIPGTSDGVNHAWNIVKLGDVYYNADSTWDAGKTEYSWLLKSPATFTDHTRSADYDTAEFHADYPMATADYVPGEVHTHEYSTVVTPPTCTEEGFTTYTCTCGHSYTDSKVAATGHTEEVIPAKAPTCTETGLTEGKKCTVCGEILTAQQTIPATGHTEETIPGKAPTCTETGLTEGKKCSVCGEILTAQETVDSLGHTWGDWVQTTAPTEDQKGEDTRECSVCHETETREVPALGHLCKNHLTAKDAVAPTCTEPGTESHYVCSCGKLYSDANAANEVQAADLVVAATGHTEETIPAKAPTCTETGLTEGKKCTVCGEILTAQETVDVLGHTWGDWVQTTAPTETEKGEDTRECSVCHETETREVPALGHICANHLTAKDAVAPTCTEPGTKAHYLCSCGKLYSDADAANEVQAADLVVAATGHTEEAIPAVAPTCTKTGLTEGKKCSVCGEILTAQQTIPATGHTEEVIPAKAPTCTETGLTEGKKCSVCGEILTAQETVGALGHTYDHGFCTVCGAEDPGFIAGDFTGDDLVTDDDAIYLLWHTLFPELYPIENDGDLTGDGLITDDDAIYLLWHTLFPELYPLYAPAAVSTAVSTTSDERGKKK